MAVVLDSAPSHHRSPAMETAGIRRDHFSSHADLVPRHPAA